MSDCLKIFLADDDEDDREMFAIALAKSGIKCDLKTFANGLALVEFFESALCWLPDLIFLDLNMPLLDGLNTLKKLRSMEKCKDLKIVIYSTSNSPGDYENTFNAGAYLYIVKPTNFSVLKKILSNLLASPQLIAKPVKLEKYIYSIH